MDEWDDGFEDDEGGADTDELEKRIDDLEAEVASLSSTVSTVRSENEEISGTVADIEEDVRNLLDIYEMVTRGINPFVDESSGFDELGGGGSFGLFDDAEEEDEAPELDEDVASADADGFFDEELIEPGDDGDFDDFDDDLDGEFDDELDDDLDDVAGELDDATNEPTDEGDDMNHDGKSFSELKEEYDAGEADWADDGDETGMDDDPFDAEASLDDDPFDDGAGFEDDAGSEDDIDAFDEPAAEPAGGDPAEMNEGGFEYVQRDDLSSPRRKPYLTSLPGDYIGDLLVMEWLEFLVAASDVTDAVRAINYYERIEWISPDAADGLRDFLSGFGTVDRNIVDRPGTARLVREHHTRSLRYITQLNGTSPQTVLLDRWDDLAGGSLVGGSVPDPAPRRRPRGRSRQHGDAPGGRQAAPRTTDAAPQAARDAYDDARTARDSEGDHGVRDGSNGHDTPREDNGAHEAQPAGRDRTGREANGTSPRPMNDPNPRSDRADPADGGWDDGY
ncbi:FlaD/FlaE family flagellar protein [Halorubrum vacuolatum]